MKPVLVSASIGVALVALAGMGRPTRASESPDACAAATVHYSATRLGVPHVDAAGLRGNLFYYTGSTLMDGRVNRSDGLVVYTGGRSANRAMKILWVIPRGAGRFLRISGRRLDGDGSFVKRWRPAGRGEFPSVLAVPSAGCWQLSMTSGKLKRRIVVQAVEPEANSSCDATPVFRREPPHPRFGPITWMPATPRTGAGGGVTAAVFVTVFPDRNEAVIPAGGHFPGGPDTKFLWWAPRPEGPLRIVGRRLDGNGSFRQAFNSAGGDIGNHSNQIIFPSTIDVPAAGCWSVTLRTGRSAGQVVFEVLPSTGSRLSLR